MAENVNHMFKIILLSKEIVLCVKYAGKGGQLFNLSKVIEIKLLNLSKCYKFYGSSHSKTKSLKFGIYFYHKTAWCTEKEH